MMSFYNVQTEDSGRQQHSPKTSFVVVVVLSSIQLLDFSNVLTLKRIQFLFILQLNKTFVIFYTPSAFVQLIARVLRVRKTAWRRSWR